MICGGCEGDVQSVSKSTIEFRGGHFDQAEIK